MSDPKPAPPAEPKKEGGVKTPAIPDTAAETGMVSEGEGAPPASDDKPGGMIGEG